MAYLYRHIRLDTNEVFYIGIGWRSQYRRARTIVRRNEFWKNVVSKTKWEAEIMFDDLSEDEAKGKEKEFIAIYGRRNLGTGTLVNLTDGGDGTSGHRVKEEVKERLSAINTGKRLSKEHKFKISQAHIGKVFSEETLAKMRAAKLGTKQSEETKKKRGLSLVGNKSRTGQKWSEVERQKHKEIRENKKREVL